jgi:hypothetical protein
MQLNHIILMLVRRIKLLFSLRMGNKKATESEELALAMAPMQMKPMQFRKVSVSGMKPGRSGYKPGKSGYKK